MRRLRGPVLALVTFVLGVAISPIHFYIEMIACGLGNSSTSYRSSYFIQVTTSDMKYESTKEAHEAFNEQLRDAIRVVEITPKLNKHGVLVGQRAVAIFFLPHLNEYRAKVIWTEGRILCRISSTSFMHVMEFEKRALAEQ